MSTNVLKSKAFAWAALVLVILVIGFSFPIRTVWWSFSDVFFIFMMVFSHLMAVYLARFNVFASKKLDFFALIFGILGVVALIVEAVLFSLGFA